MSEETTDFLQKVYYGNTIQDYLIALGIIFGGLLILRLFRRTILGQLKKWSQRTETAFDDYLIKGIDRFGLPIVNFLVIYYGITYLCLSDKAIKLLDTAAKVVIIFYIIRLLSSIIRLVLESFIRKQPEGEEKLKQLTGIMLIINAVIWILGLLFLFDNLGYNVTTLVAGLGIGGIAIALAAQNILGDLFNYFVIFFDRPFEVGDSITVDAKSGTVEYIGIKTTRLKSTTGEQLIFSNSDLTNSRIHNFKRMERRRVVFSLGVTYNTPADKLKNIPAMIQQLVEAQQDVTFDRAHLARLNESSLDFEVVYFVENSDFKRYMDIQQQINLEILNKFTADKIGFAYPTQTLVLSRQAAEPTK